MTKLNQPSATRSVARAVEDDKQRTMTVEDDQQRSATTPKQAELYIGEQSAVVMAVADGERKRVR